jgi:hypothetical protein
METLIETIRAATASEASDELRVAGAQACRAILASLEPKQETALATPSIPTNPMQAVLTVIQSTPPDRLLDLAIAKLRSMLPSNVESPAVRPLHVPLVILPPQLSKGGVS